jgi:NhaP-type Na+/H+ or K+/H+ antiporter
LLIPAIALLCFSTAQALGGSGFIASFVGGIVFGGFMKERAQRFVEPAEALGDGASLLTWVVFGAAIVGDLLVALTWQMGLYAALSLTLVRMLPIWLCLRGTDVRLDEAMFLGWFGPRGLASIVFTLMAIEAGLPGAHTIAMIVAGTVTLSILAHGVSAKPLSAWIASKARGGAT